jgi:hypothetical protein
VRGGQAQLRRYQAIRISASQFVDLHRPRLDFGKKSFTKQYPWTHTKVALFLSA